MSVVNGLDAALEPVLLTLRADGYDGRYEQLEGRLLLEIVAGEGACENCLSSKEIMRRVVESSLQRAGYDLAVDLRYPTDPR